MDEAARLEAAVAEGEARGRTEGEAKGRIDGEAKGRTEGEAEGKLKILEMVKQMLLNGLGIELTSQISGMSAEEIKKLT
jgi:predicted transposase YdaD